MPFPKMISTPFIGLTAMAMTACGTTSDLRIAQIPVRDGLRACPALAPMPPEALPPIAEDPAARAPQLQERALWMGRDISQTAVNREACDMAAELLALIDANNAGSQN